MPGSVDKMDLICEEGEDLWLHLRYDPLFRSRSPMPGSWPGDPEIRRAASGCDGHVEGINRERRFACPQAVSRYRACVKNHEL